jgi:hypothetical protein
MKNLFENLFNCKEFKKITDLLVEAYVKKLSGETGKRNFISDATEWMKRYQYQSNENLASIMNILQTPKTIINNGQGEPLIEEDLDEKINIIIEILSERKKDIKQIHRNIVTWSSIILSLILGITGIFLSQCSTVKFNETQFNDIKQSIQQLKSLKPIDVPISNDTINIKATDTLKVNITNNRARTKLKNQLK